MNVKRMIDILPWLEPKYVLLCLAVFLATVAPGFLVVYNYKPSLVKEYDTLKVVLFATSLTLPILLVNIFLVAEARSAARTSREREEKKKQEDKGREQKGERPWKVTGDVFIASIITFFGYYLAIGTAYVLALKFVSFIGIIVGIEVLLFAICVTLVYCAGTKAKHSEQQTPEESK